MMGYEIPEKGQVTPYDIVSFGIPVCTRHGKAYEMIELIKFTGLLAEKGLTQHLESVFYNSVSCCCEFTFKDHFDQYSSEADAIKECALRSIGQFDWFDFIMHGEPGISWD